MKSNFRQSGFRLVLSLWFTAVGIKSNAAEASAGASAFVVSPVSVNSAIMVLWSASFMSEATVGRRIIRIAGIGLSAAEHGEDANAIEYFASAGGTGLAQFTRADFIKLAAGKGTLSGDLISDLAVSALTVTGNVTVTVAYN